MLVSRSLTCLALCLFLVGCGGGDDAATSDTDTDLGASETLGPAESIDQAMAASAGEDDSSGEQPEATSGETETPAGDATAFALSPDNTQIQFIGTHAGDDPNPRTGEFTDFSGEATLGGNGGITAVNVEIQTASLTTPIDNLTTHLKSPDFLDVREHPTITFETTSIDVADEMMTLNGNLTLMGTTKEVSFPAEVSITDGQLALSTSLMINRSEFGMDGSLDRVNDEVEIKVTVGEAG